MDNSSQCMVSNLTDYDPSVMVIKRTDKYHCVDKLNDYHTIVLISSQATSHCVDKLTDYHAAVLINSLTTMQPC